MNISSRETLLISVATVSALVVALLGAHLWDLKTQKGLINNQLKQSVLPDQSENQSSQSKIDRTIEYKSNVYGFAIDIPEVWDGYTVGLVPQKDLQQSQATAWFDFNLPKYNGVFSVVVYTPRQWQRVKADLVAGEADNDKVLIGDVYVVRFGQGQLLASGAMPDDDPVLAQQLQQVAEIKDSLRTTDVNPLPYWNTYHNKVLGFTFQYPENWIVEGASEPDGIPVLRLWSAKRLNMWETFAEKKIVGEGPTANMGITVYPDFNSVRNVGNTGVKDLASLVKQNFFRNVQTVIVGGERGYRAIESGVTDNAVWIIPHAGKYYEFVTDFDSNKDDVQIHNEVLQTVQFVK